MYTGLVHAGEHQRQREQLGRHASVVTDSAHIDYDDGPNNSDRRHALVASGSVVVPWDVVRGRRCSPRARRCRSARSRASTSTATQRSPTTCLGRRATCSTAATTTRCWRRSTPIARPSNLALPAISQRSARTSSTALDIRASKSIPLRRGRQVELIGQVFNLFNRKNLLAAWQTNARSPAVRHHRVGWQHAAGGDWRFGSRSDWLVVGGSRLVVGATNRQPPTTNH